MSINRFSEHWKEQKPFDIASMLLITITHKKFVTCNKDSINSSTQYLISWNNQVAKLIQLGASIANMMPQDVKFSFGNLIFIINPLLITMML